MALVVGGYYYVNGGQIMSTDNAYIQADMVGLTTDVSGIVDQINVHENEAVKAGQVLFSLQPDSFKIALDGAKAQLGAAAQPDPEPEGQLPAVARRDHAGRSRSSLLPDRVRSPAKPRQQLGRDTSRPMTRPSTISMRRPQKVAVAKAEPQPRSPSSAATPTSRSSKTRSISQAKAKVDNAQRELDHSVVKAPFDGIVTNVNALQVGSYLQASPAGLLAGFGTATCGSPRARRKPSSPTSSPASR